MHDVKAKIDNRARQLDAAEAATDADMAEAGASAALDFADWAVGNAKLALFDAGAYTQTIAPRSQSPSPVAYAPLGSAQPSRASPLVC